MTERTNWDQAMFHSEVPSYLVQFLQMEKLSFKELMHFTVWMVGLSENLPSQSRCSVMPRHMTWWIELRQEFQPMLSPLQREALYSTQLIQPYRAVPTIAASDLTQGITSLHPQVFGLNYFTFFSTSLEAQVWVGRWCIYLQLGVWERSCGEDLNLSQLGCTLIPSRSWGWLLSLSSWLSRPQHTYFCCQH